MQQIFVLDTSVLIHAPDALDRFGEHQIMMPLTVIEELDGVRNGLDKRNHRYHLSSDGSISRTIC